jgi:hypothetical protein
VHRLGHLGHSVLFGFKFGPSVFGKNPGYAVAALIAKSHGHVILIIRHPLSFLIVLTLPPVFSRQFIPAPDSS